MSACIWCKKTAQPHSLEHIIPDALGCPEGFHLTGGAVCRACNNGLAHLDQAVLADLDILAFMAGVPRKGGRPPEIRGRGNMIATVSTDGPSYSINMDPVPTTAHEGSRLVAFTGKSRQVKASLRREGNVGHVNWKVRIGESPKFRRGITKIAFSALAFYQGVDEVLADKYDEIRSFVILGKPDRPVFMTASPDNSVYRNQVWAPYTKDGGFALTFRLAQIEFCVDLTPGLELFPELLRMAPTFFGGSWSCLPPKARILAG